VTGEAAGVAESDKIGVERHLATHPPSLARDVVVDEHPAHIGRREIRCTDRVPPPQRRQQGLLHEVLRVEVITRQQKGQPEEWAGLSGDELIEAWVSHRLSVVVHNQYDASSVANCCTRWQGIPESRRSCPGIRMTRAVLT